MERFGSWGWILLTLVMGFGGPGAILGEWLHATRICRPAIQPLYRSSWISQVRLGKGLPEALVVMQDKYVHAGTCRPLQRSTWYAASFTPHFFQPLGCEVADDEQ